MNNRNPHVYARPHSNDEGNNNEPHYAQEGITLRDMAALEAFKAIITGLWTNPGDRDDAMATPPSGVAQTAFLYADAFIAERSRPADEAEAQHRKQMAQYRQAPYYHADNWVVWDDNGGSMTFRCVWDREEKQFVAIEVEDGETWTAITAEHAPIIARMMQDESLHDPAAAADCHMDPLDELPEWAQQSIARRKPMQAAILKNIHNSMRKPGDDA